MNKFLAARDPAWRGAYTIMHVIVYLGKRLTRRQAIVLRALYRDVSAHRPGISASGLTFSGGWRNVASSPATSTSSGGSGPLAGPRSTAIPPTGLRA